MFVRPGELRHARWADINLDKAEWRYTTSKTKTPNIVPLARQSVEILRDIRPFARRSEYVFPGVRSLAKPISENTINAALRYLGFDNSEMTAHGFRAMARTLLDEVLGFRPDFIEHQLAHAVRDPLGRAYNRTSQLEERAGLTTLTLFEKIRVNSASSTSCREQERSPLADRGFGRLADAYSPEPR